MYSIGPPEWLTPLSNKFKLVGFKPVPKDFDNCEWNHFFLLKTHSTICKYNWALFSGSVPSNSSHKMQRGAVFRGLAAIPLRFLSHDIRFESLLARPGLPLKYLVTNSFTWFSVNPSIWSSVSITFAVAGLWHLGCTLSSINSEKIVNLLDDNSSNPSNINKMPDWFSRIKWNNCCLLSLSMSRRGSWSCISTFQQQYCFESWWAAALRLLLFCGSVVGVLLTMVWFSHTRFSFNQHWSLRWKVFIRV